MVHDPQLTIYSLALSRLTRLRLLHFSCAWFDGEHFYEFYPLHVVHKAPARGTALTRRVHLRVEDTWPKNCTLKFLRELVTG